MISISLVFVGAKKIRELNRKYRGIDKVTSILTFYYGQAIPNENLILGDIVICPPEAKRKNLSIDELIIHGIKSLLSEISTTKIF